MLDNDIVEDSVRGNQPDARFFGRRKGPALSGRKQALVDQLLPTILVPVGKAAPASLDPAALCDWQPKRVEVEIGFGKGEHLAAHAAANPDCLYIGCEPYINGVAGLLTLIEEEGLQNIRIYPDDARHLLQALKGQSVDRLYLIHPDPWPKKRHARRRFVYGQTIDSVARVLKAGGAWRIGTDHPIYLRWAVMQLANRADFHFDPERPDDWRHRPKDWQKTRYETKALEGKATYLQYSRVDGLPMGAGGT